MKLRSLVAVVTSFALVLALSSACAGGPFPPRTDPDMVGVVYDLYDDPGNDVFTVFMDGIEGSDITKAAVSITEETQLLARDGDGYRLVEREEIAIGDTVEAWFDGPVRESFPVQADARAIVVR